MKKLRVLQFITPSGFYGAERWVLALANNFNKDEVDCDLAVTRESPTHDLSIAKYFPTEIGKVHYMDMSGRFDLSVIKKLVSIIRERKIQIIHTHGYKSDILGLIAARISGIKCVSTPHGFSGNVGFKLSTFIKIGTYFLKFFDSVVPLSEELMDDMERYKVPEKKVTFIRNGVDIREIDNSIQVMNSGRSEKSLQDEKKIIGFIGQMIPRKGVTDLINIFDSIYNDNPDVSLKLVGDGALRPELEQLASSLSSKENIDFLGYREDRLELLSKFNVFAMTSSLEGIPRCMMEAMAVGIPMVGYDIPGVDKLIEHKKTGLLVPYGDKEGFVKSCHMILNDPVLANELKVAARAKVEKEFSAERMSNEYLELFSFLTH